MTMNRTTLFSAAMAAAFTLGCAAACAQVEPAAPAAPALPAAPAFPAVPAPAATPAVPAAPVLRHAVYYVRALPAASPMPMPAPPEPPAEYEGQAQPAPLPADVKDDLFQGTETFAKNAVSATEINMGPDSLDLVGGSQSHRANSMVLNVVRTYTYDKPGMYDAAEVEKFRSKLNSGDWSCSVRTRDLKNGSSSDICHKRRADGLRETAIVTVEPKSLTFIHTIRRASENGNHSSNSSSSSSSSSYSYGDYGDYGAMFAPLASLGALSSLSSLDTLPQLAMLDPQAMGDVTAAFAGTAGAYGYDNGRAQAEAEQLARTQVRIAEGEARFAEGEARMATSQARMAESLERGELSGVQGADGQAEDRHRHEVQLT